MAWIKSAGGAWTNTKDGTTLIKSASGAWNNTKKGSSIIKTAGGAWVGSGCDDEEDYPAFVLDDNDDFGGF